MSQQQNSNAPTNADTETPVSFADVSLDTLRSSYNDTYRVCKGSASQVVLGFQSMSERLQEPSNEYQQTLYPKLSELCMRLYNQYVETFLTRFDSDVERQVFGANLNGNRNNGSLYRSIPSGVNRNLTYNYAQFGQLMRVLTSRLRFIAQRDPSSVQRYRDSAEETNAYNTLQNRVNTFLTFVTNLLTEWNTLVSETRSRFASTSQTDVEQSQQYRQYRQYRQQRQYRPNHNSQLGETNEMSQSQSQSQSQSRSTRYNRQDRQDRQTRQHRQNDNNGEWVTPNRGYRTRRN